MGSWNQAGQGIIDGFSAHLDGAKNVFTQPTFGTGHKRLGGISHVGTQGIQLLTVQLVIDSVHGGGNPRQVTGVFWSNEGLALDDDDILGVDFLSHLSETGHQHWAKLQLG